jgi:ParB family chromosome partitioning protein
MAIRKKEKQKHLGRGLESLLGPITSVRQVYSNRKNHDDVSDANFPPDKELRASFEEISIDSISPNPYQARTVWDQQEMEDLAESIKANGIIQPLRQME